MKLDPTTLKNKRVLILFRVDDKRTFTFRGPVVDASEDTLTILDSKDGRVTLSASGIVSITEGIP